MKRRTLTDTYGLDEELPPVDTKLLVVSTLAIVSLLFLAIGVATGVAAGQLDNTTGSYYNDSDADIDNESWMANRSDPTLENSTHFFSRIAGVTIGANGRAAGTLLIGLLSFGAVASIMGTSDVGIVAGGSTAILVVAALTTAGFAPSWMYALVLFAVGLLLAGPLKRVIQ